MDLSTLTLTETLSGLYDKKFSSVEVTKASINRIKSVEPKIHALITVTEKEALEQAAHADKAILSGVNLPLL